ncbi:MAG: pyridoxal-phosphate dependent enzyme [SAR324 cluster bacterium]|nr:pyridoxal-phosphate dependent enzyme [SAR324 cluster bacterium]MBL7034288.1 pyridoxal-phosphate dependent enzyme [SAR324 cluster bacterium]
MLSFNYKCSQCDTVYEISPELMLCPDCSCRHKPGQPLSGVLEVELKGTLTSSNPLEFLPVEAEFFPTIPVGNTPLWHPQNLVQKHGFPELYFKDDGVNPTGSLKDRASFLVAAFARKHAVREVVVASTGNAGSSMAGVGAAAGLKVKLVLPKTAPPAKMIQALQYGADVVLAEKNYDQAFALSLEYSRTRGGMNRNTAYNPMTIEGKKTVAIEIFNQLAADSAAGKAPDHVFVGVGDGVIISGIYKGFRDLLQLGRISKIPTIHAVQASGSAAIFRAMESGTFDGQAASTVADSISVDVPSNGLLALKNLRAHNGRCLTVTDDEILSAQQELSSNCGLFSEPAAATAYAGFLKQKSTLDSSEICVVLLTGNGLKDIASAAKKIVMPENAINSLDEI